MRRFDLLAMGFAFALVASAQAPAQDVPRFEEEVDVNLVLVDAIVTDDKGRQILGLRADDFVITEEGEPQEIASVQYFTNRRLLTSPEKDAPFEVEHRREGRLFLLFFHKPDPSNSPLRSQLMRALRASRDFVEEQLLPEDRVAVVGFDFRLKVFSDFSSDRRQLFAALDQVARFSNGLTSPESETGDVSLFTGLDRETLVKRTGTIYTALEKLAESIDSVPARKVLVMFSPGIEPRTGSSFPVIDDPGYEPMIHALNEANVSVYTVSMIEREARSAFADSMLSRIASETGGEYVPIVVHYGTPLQTIENRNNGYYLITYYSRKPHGEHGYQEIEVKLRNPQFHLSVRRGYRY